MSSRSSRGGGKYSSSSVTRTGSTPCGGCELGDHRFDEVLGCARTRRHADDARIAEAFDVELFRAVDAHDDRASRVDRDLRECDRVRRVGAADHDDRVGFGGDASERVLPVRRGEAQIVARRGPQFREPRARLVEHVGPLVVGQRRLGEHRDALGVGDLRERRVELVFAFHEVDRFGGDGERADGFVVAGVADVEDGEALAGAHLGLVVDLGDERADRVDDVAAFRGGGLDDLGRGAVGRQHQRRTGGHIGDVVDEDHALFAEAFDDEAVVHDLVVAVHRRFERAHHPGERLDRHLDPGAESAGFGEEHLLDRHRLPR